MKRMVMLLVAVLALMVSSAAGATGGSPRVICTGSCDGGGGRPICSAANYQQSYWDGTRFEFCWTDGRGNYFWV